MTTAPHAVEDSELDLTVEVSDSATGAQAGAIGRIVGRYVILDVLGQGGMGRVVRAYDPKLSREVALKLLKDEADPIARARIAREAQAMAQLSHPNVVAIYDVEVEGEPPFIAMEMVEGTTLRDWLRESERPWREIVEAYLQAGEGLAAAHEAGLVHRDFKPANVLRSSDGRIRVTDFGIARSQDASASVETTATGPALASSTQTHGPPESSSGRSLPILTQAGHAVGTPVYMAPEQHHGLPADARSDQYSFCIALWEALAGQRPFSGGLPELVSAKSLRRLSTVPSPRSVPGHLRGALLRGLDPDPTARHASMRALLAALQRDPTRVRRVTAAASVAGLAAAAWWGVSEVRERAAASGCEEQGRAIVGVWDLQARARVEAAFTATGVPYAAEQLERILPKLDAYADSWAERRTQACNALRHRELPGSLRARSDTCFDEARIGFEAQVGFLAQADAGAVRRAVDAVDSIPSSDACGDEAALQRKTALPDDPRIRDEITAIHAELEVQAAHSRMGRHQEALRMAEALLQRAEATAWGPVIARTRQVLAAAASATGDVDRAIDSATQAFFEAGRVGHDHLSQISSRHLTHLVGVNKTDVDQALRWNDISMMFWERMGGRDETARADILNARGAALEVAGRYEEAMAAHQEALRIRSENLPPDHPVVLGSMTNVGMTYYGMGEYDKALALHKEALERRRAVVGPNHPDLVELYNQVGITYEVTGHYPEARGTLETALALAEATMGRQHPLVGDLYNNLGNVYNDLGDNERSLEAIRAAIEIYKVTDGPRSMSVARSLNNLGNALAGLARFEESLQSQREALSILDEVLGADHGHCGMVRDNMGVILEDLERPDEAMQAYLEGLAIREKAFGPDHPDVALSLAHLGSLYRTRGQYDASIDAFERGLKIRAQQDTPAPVMADLQYGLALSLWEAGRDRPRALELAVRARDNYAQSGSDYQPLRDEVETWIAARSDP